MTQGQPQASLMRQTVERHRETARMSGDAVDLVRVVQGIRGRARFARLSWLALIALLTAIGVGTAYVFLAVSTSSPILTIAGSVTGSTITAATGPLDWVSELTRSFIRIAAVIMAVSS
jgi:hypothetical protein